MSAETINYKKLFDYLESRFFHIVAIEPVDLMPASGWDIVVRIDDMKGEVVYEGSTLVDALIKMRESDESEILHNKVERILNRKKSKNKAKKGGES